MHIFVDCCKKKLLNLINLNNDAVSEPETENLVTTLVNVLLYIICTDL